MNLVDSHVHLDHQDFHDDVDALIERAHAQGIARMLTIGTGDGPPRLDCAIELAARHQGLFATVGVHPHDAAKAGPATFDSLRALLNERSVIAIGEIGLDYHYDFSPREVQREVFVEQLRIALAASKPIIIHTREAWSDTMDILRREWAAASPDRRGIMHCFTGDEAQAREALALGFHLSFGGVLTFKTAENVRQAAAIVPDDRILVETDAPYLAPIPYRGKRNEPAFMVETVKRLAQVRGVEPDHIAAVTTANFERLAGCLRG